MTASAVVILMSRSVTAAHPGAQPRGIVLAYPVASISVTVQRDHRLTARGSWPATSAALSSGTCLRRCNLSLKSAPFEQEQGG
jgi:hypothetical protein